jgi:hypothetical protein
MANYYYADSTRQPKGPVPQEELRILFNQGKITASSLVAEVGASEWQPLSQVLTDLLPPTYSPNNPSPPQSSPPPATPYAPPGAQPFAPMGADFRKIPNYLTQAILCTLFCCLPFGIVAIVFASKVDGLQLMGDQYGAMTASNSAKTWCWIAFAIGLILWSMFLLAGGLS